LVPFDGRLTLPREAAVNSFPDHLLVAGDALKAGCLMTFLPHLPLARN